MLGHLGGSVGAPGTTVLYQGQPPLNIYYRPLQSSDYDALKVIHRDLFPIDYEEVFFRKAVSGEDRVFSWAALHSEYGRDHLVGFVTARLVYLYECDPMDRQVMGLSAKCLDSHCAVYVLTLGVVPSCRQCGIARSLLGLVQQHAVRMRCRSIFLHVISYNDAAMRLYGTSGYQPMARLPNFYHLITGRQPIPDQSWYDAFLYALSMPSSGPEPSPAMQWAGGMLGAAVAPFRTMLGTFNGCMPTWLCRQTYSTFLPYAASAPQRSTSKGSLSDTATSSWQQQPPPLQQQQQPPTPPFVQHPHPASGSFVGATGEQYQQQQQQYATPYDRSSGGGAPGRHYSQYNGATGSAHGGASAASYGPESYGGSSPTASAASGPCEPHFPGRPQSRAAGQQHQQHQHQQHQQHQQQHQQPVGVAMLRPPPPLVPPSLSAGQASLQQRHPHSGGGDPGTPQYRSPGGQYSHHQHQHHQGHSYSHGAHPANGGIGGNGSGSISGSGNGASQQYHPYHIQPQAQGHGQGRLGEPSRSGVQRPPPGLAGGGLQQYPLQQPQQDSSILTTLFRPPSAQPRQHSR